MPQTGTLGHAETVLFVNDRHTQTAEPDRIFYQGVGAYQQLHRTVKQSGMDFVALALTGRAGKQAYVYAELGNHAAQAVIMLCGKNLGRCHKTCLRTVVDSQKHRHQRHNGLARAYIPLYETVHLPAGGHIRMYLVHDALLCSGQVKRQTFAVKAIEKIAHSLHGPSAALILAAPGTALHVDLYKKQLFELQPKACGLKLRVVLRIVDCNKRFT